MGPRRVTLRDGRVEQQHPAQRGGRHEQPSTDPQRRNLATVCGVVRRLP
jgi:hypothetical protein